MNGIPQTQRYYAWVNLGKTVGNQQVLVTARNLNEAKRMAELQYGNCKSVCGVTPLQEKILDGRD